MQGMVVYACNPDAGDWLRQKDHECQASLEAKLGGPWIWSYHELHSTMLSREKEKEKKPNTQQQ